MFEQQYTLFMTGLIELSLLALIIALAFGQNRRLTRATLVGFGEYQSSVVFHCFILKWTARVLTAVWIFWCFGWIQSMAYYN